MPIRASRKRLTGAQGVHDLVDRFGHSSVRSDDGSGPGFIGPFQGRLDVIEHLHQYALDSDHLVVKLKPVQWSFDGRRQLHDVLRVVTDALDVDDNGR